MSAKGIKPSKEADIMVDVRILTQDRVEATATTTGSGYHGYYYGGGFSTTQVTYSEYTDGTLILTIIEKESEKIIWQGAGSKTLNENLSPQKRDETIAYSIKQILKNYPPKE